MLRCTILVAVGANLQGPAGRLARDTCIWAAERLDQLPGLRRVGVSRWYRSPAWPPSDQPDYVNGVVRLAGEADPEALLRVLHGIEAEAGRVRSVANAARTLDLDLLAVDGLVVDIPALTLPHPRLQDRAFVLAPMLDVAPEWRDPRTGLGVAAMLAGVDMAGLSSV